MKKHGVTYEEKEGVNLTGFCTKTIVKGNDIVRVENTEWTNRSKLRVEARKWVAAKLKPKKYGDKVETETKITYSNAPDWLTGEII